VAATSLHLDSFIPFGMFFKRRLDRRREPGRGQGDLVGEPVPRVAVMVAVIGLPGSTLAASNFAVSVNGGLVRTASASRVS